VPVGFISDHMEVQYDLDTEASARCQQLGLNMVRAGTAGTHPQFIAMIRELILEVASRGITIILASHLLDEVQKICSHVAVLSKGKLLFSGVVSEVLAVADCIELVSDNMEALKVAISSYDKFRSLVMTDGKYLVYFNGDVTPGDINDFLFRKGIVLTHLSERKRSLEKHFLELLEENP